MAGVIAGFVAAAWYSLIAKNQFLYGEELRRMAPSVDPHVTRTDRSVPPLPSLTLERNDYAIKVAEAVKAQMIIEICVLALIISAFVLTAGFCFMRLQQGISEAQAIGQDYAGRRRQSFSDKLQDVLGHLRNLQFRICFMVFFVFLVFILKMFSAIVVAGSYNITNTFSFDGNACEDAGNFDGSSSCASQGVDVTCRCVRPLPLKLVPGGQVSRLQARHPLDCHPCVLTSDPACYSLG